VKTLTVIACLALSGCATMTPAEKHFAVGVGVVLAAGLIAAHNKGPVQYPGPAPISCQTNPRACQ
jgi:hypothetical protein